MTSGAKLALQSAHIRATSARPRRRAAHVRLVVVAGRAVAADDGRRGALDGDDDRTVCLVGKDVASNAILEPAKRVGLRGRRASGGGGGGESDREGAEARGSAMRSDRCWTMSLTTFHLPSRSNQSLSGAEYAFEVSLASDRSVATSVTLGISISSSCQSSVLPHSESCASSRLSGRPARSARGV